MKFLEYIWISIYFFVALLAAIILYPFSFLVSKKHYESDGYDKWNLFFMKWQMIMMLLSNCLLRITHILMLLLSNIQNKRSMCQNFLS